MENNTLETSHTNGTNENDRATNKSRKMGKVHR